MNEVAMFVTTWPEAAVAIAAMLTLAVVAWAALR